MNMHIHKQINNYQSGYPYLIDDNATYFHCKTKSRSPASLYIVVQRLTELLTVVPYPAVNAAE